MHKHTNRLAEETSPYLLQHAHNPVDWYPWGEEAIEKAKKEDKPILVSIGYSACHWCHVMERESFENEETARMMNDFFVNIKIDREERPDIDHIYMDAVQAMTGSGGWPLNVFLTPDCKPFYGGTYFPPVRAYNRGSWRETITAIRQAYKERKSEIETQATSLVNHIESSNDYTKANTAGAQISKEELQAIAHNLLKAADTKWGGFGKAPKFPQTFSIQYLLRHYYFTKDQEALMHALLSLDKMIYGGIYDQLEGGFARYSTDDKWLVPHFEKMLYDNALLIIAMAEAYKVTKNKLYQTTILDTIEFVERELMHPEGGFYSALDADSEGVEGKFYTWSKEEIGAVLGEDTELFCKFYDVSQEGNWEHTNILWVKLPYEEFAAANNIGLSTLYEILDRSRKKLLKQRQQRIRPLLDDKILLSWNALMNTALCKAYEATGVEHLKQIAEKNIAFLEDNFTQPGSNQWFHTFKNGEAKYFAFLDDYAYLVSSYISLSEITAKTEYLTKAKDITELILSNFGEEQSGFFYFTHQFQKDIIVRKKEVYDGATPSGNSVMAFNLQYLSVVFDNRAWFDRAFKLTTSLSQPITRYPTSFGVWALNMQQLFYGLNEIAVIGKGAKTLLPLLLTEYIPNRVLQASDKAGETFPLLENKPVTDETNIYLCKNYACLKPVSTVKELLKILTI